MSEKCNSFLHHTDIINLCLANLNPLKFVACLILILPNALAWFVVEFHIKPMYKFQHNANILSTIKMKSWWNSIYKQFKF